MRDPDAFDAFYKDARERLLAQTFALTGDLAASRRAVRDAFIVAWHHWRKLSQLDDPESVVRPHAWRLAQHRHTARIWHRDKSIGPDVKATLDALGKVSAHQRRALILTQLAAVSMPQMAREVGVPLEVAERELQQGATQLSLLLDVQTPALRSRFDDVASSVNGTVRWPRPTIVRRAGATRRRSHTAVGVVAVVTTLVVTGSLLTDAAGVRPTLDRPVVAAPAPPEEPETTEDPAAGVTEPVPAVLPESSLLDASDLRDRIAGPWSVVGTRSNDEGTGLVLPCQLERYADPRGVASLVRTFTTDRRGRPTGTRDQSTLEAIQLTEASSSEKRSRRAYNTTTSWLGDCLEERTQLISTSTPRGVGDEAVEIVLQSWGRPKRTYVVGVARTGAYTTSALVSAGLADATGPTTRTAVARLLASAVAKLCALPDGGSCSADRPKIALRPPLEAGTAPAMLSTIDLPPIDGIGQPWVGTEPRVPLTNDAASPCDSTEFRGRFQGDTFTNNATRTFVIPEADLPQEFGLTQTVGSLRGDRAAALVERVRASLTGCDSLNTEVTRVARTDGRDTSLTAWRLTIEVTDNRTVTFFMAILRDGTSVSQIGFLPRSGEDLGSGGFVALAERALERLGELPRPGRS